jgi:dihydrofolate reductase
VTRRVIAYLATSADGYIARPDGDVTWLDRPRPRDNYGMAAFLRSIDTILWGRKTYDMALTFGDSGLGFSGKIKHYVFTHQPPAARPEVEFVTEPVAAFAERFRDAPGKHAWMMGGADIIASFLDAGAIDEFMIHVIPVLIGEGIPLIAPRHRLVRLALRSTRQFPDGVVRLHYVVKREAVTRSGHGRRARGSR